MEFHQLLKKFTVSYGARRFIITGSYSETKQNGTQSHYKLIYIQVLPDCYSINVFSSAVCYNIFSEFHFYIHVIDIAPPFKKERVMAVSINNIHQLLLMG